ncbi:hypothetical protein SNOG_00002 [Parastagonospora nodorum SN15]|uniref:DUF5703 domain-containing protein n=1 Tax=Phaeosphaeria nodorum (strain SN15 / ATCC MYA-4574 / FGSC 10173) TaxID=321614 RepID=Q0V7L2_PHANO|nr:hypothetical protein SNOG_00002 [Parastagonospora nodorum SN15]EAT91497.2 hypothetical protein SNOG_00002 [Parastagonospora nodorum SN15]
MSLLAKASLILFTLIARTLAALPASYDVAWTTPGVNGSADSMPLGGGDIGINTWFEDGSILMYIAKSGTFDENNSLLKLGRVRLSFQPNPFDHDTFEQRLLLNSGYVQFTGKDNATAKIWVDVFNPVVHVEIDSPEKIALKVAYENWRFEDHELVNEERNQGSWGLYTSKVRNGTTYADSIGFHENGVLMSHRNDKLDLWDFQLKQQGLEEHAETMYNPMRNNEFGIFVHSEQLRPGDITNGTYVNTTFKAWNLDTKTARKSFKVNFTLHQAQTSSHKEWYDGLKNVMKSAINATQEASLDWWRDWWDRSYIIINEDQGEDDPGFQVGKNYQIWRFLMGCNALGVWPTKFNGGLWTFDPVYVNKFRPYTPDHRRWGGGTFTAQNQRLLYWPLLRSGDFDTMTQQFDFYKRITPNAVLRGQVYQGIDAAYFLEQTDNTGLSNVFEYNAQYYDDDQNTPRPDFFPEGELWNVWLNHMQDTANEFADMILQANIYSGYDVKPYLEFIEYQLAWFDKYYTKKMQEGTPWGLTGFEIPQLYTVFPWPEYGLGLPNLTYAINTYLYDTETQSYHGNAGWKQDVIWLARMGLTTNATAMTEQRFAPSTVCKFPTFKGPNFDWTPDLNHFGAAAIGLQEQLMQTFVGNDIRLLGAWPKTWDARFKLYAPHNTTV